MIVHAVCTPAPRSVRIRLKESFPILRGQLFETQTQPQHNQPQHNLTTMSAAQQNAPFTEPERVAICRDYYHDNERDTEQQENATYSHGGLVGALMPVSLRGPPRKALREQLLGQPTWTQNCTNSQVWNYLAVMWVSCLDKRSPPAVIDQHPTMKNRRVFRWEYSHDSLMEGLAVYLPLYLCLGPQYSPTKVNGNYVNALVPEIAMRDDLRYCLYVPILQSIWMHGDPERTLRRQKNWEQLMTNKSLGHFIEGCRNKVVRFGVWSYDYIAERAVPEHPQYSTKSTVLKKWHAGLQFEIALVLRVLVQDFPLPVNGNWFVTSQQKAAYKAQMVRNPDNKNVPLRPW